MHGKQRIEHADQIEGGDLAIFIHITKKKEVYTPLMESAAKASAGEGISQQGGYSWVRDVRASRHVNEQRRCQIVWYKKLYTIAETGEPIIKQE